MSNQLIDPKWFRRVLGNYPTGVSVVTAVDGDGAPVGMAVGSFTSVSLDPPLVAFLPDRSSSSWPRIQRAGAFCVNVLAADQEHICRAFATSGADKFAGVDWSAARSGSPIVDGAIAWVDCDLEAVHEAGDHYIVIGRVRELDVANSSLPLLFFQGGYGRFTPRSLVTGDLALIHEFRKVDLARHELERLASESGVESSAAVVAGEEIVVIASAGQPQHRLIPTRVGQRFAYVAPAGIVFVAWAPPDEVEAWLERPRPQLEAEERERYAAALGRVRDAGYSMVVGTLASDRDHAAASASPAAADLRPYVRNLQPRIDEIDFTADPGDWWATLSAPAFDADGKVSLAINLYGFERIATAADLERYAELLIATANRITELNGGRRP